jgi:hypothetical protein
LPSFVGEAATYDRIKACPQRAIMSLELVVRNAITIEPQVVGKLGNVAAEARQYGLCLRVIHVKQRQSSVKRLA